MGEPDTYSRSPWTLSRAHPQDRFRHRRDDTKWVVTWKSYRNIPHPRCTSISIYPPPPSATPLPHSRSPQRNKAGVIRSPWFRIPASRFIYAVREREDRTKPDTGIDLALLTTVLSGCRSSSTTFRDVSDLHLCKFVCLARSRGVGISKIRGNMYRRFKHSCDTLKLKTQPAAPQLQLQGVHALPRVSTKPIGDSAWGIH